MVWYVHTILIFYETIYTGNLVEALSLTAVLLCYRFEIFNDVYQWRFTPFRIYTIEDFNGVKLFSLLLVFHFYYDHNIYRLQIWNKHPLLRLRVRIQIFTGIKRAPTALRSGGCADQQVYEIFIGVNSLMPFGRQRSCNWRTTVGGSQGCFYVIGKKNGKFYFLALSRPS